MDVSTRFTQVKQLKTLAALHAHLDRLGVTIPTSATDVDPARVLATPVEIHDAARTLVVPNRIAVLPMEGWDGSTDGRPTDLVRRRWQRFGASGCGLVWGEATAVRADGRANPNQLVITDETVADLAALRLALAPGQVAGLQLTHSGRWSRPDGAPAPRTAYAHPLLDGRAGATAASVLTDDELDELVADFVDAAARARAVPASTSSTSSTVTATSCTSCSLRTIARGATAATSPAALRSCARLSPASARACPISRSR